MNHKKSLIDEFNKSGLTYGDLLSHKDIDRMAGLKYPRYEEISSHEEMNESIKRYGIKRMSAIEGLREYALDERNMYLQSVVGDGYRIAHPNEQTDLSVERGMKMVKKGLTHAERGVTHINRALLTVEEQAYNLSVRARMAGLALMIGRKSGLLSKDSD